MPINATVNAMLNASGSLTTDYDGMVLFEGTSFDELLAGFSSPQALSIINPNEELFLERNLTITIPMNFASVVDKEPCEP
ncbi:hypothetical protein B0H11DRAFT_1707585 [Mycena galericulata]|nr:hypothetical protein B0H11DRAFT_1707585 [Mycena galericulata]